MLKIVDATTRTGRRELDLLLASRRAAPDFATLKQVLPVVEDVLRRREPALRKYVERFDLPARGGPSYPSKKIFFALEPAAKSARVRGSEAEISPEFRRAFHEARRRIEAYHRRQLPSGFAFTDALGVSFVERPVPLDSVGVYVPGRTRVLPVVAPDGRRAGAGRGRPARRRRDAAARLGGQPGAALGGARAGRPLRPSRGRRARRRRARLRRKGREDRRARQPLRRGRQAPRLGSRGRRPAGGPFRGRHPRLRRRRSGARRGGPSGAGRARPGREMPSLHELEPTRGCRLGRDRCATEGV